MGLDRAGDAEFLYRPRVGGGASWLKRSGPAASANRHQSGAFSGRRCRDWRAAGVHGPRHLSEIADPLSDDSDEQAASEDAFIVQRAMELIRKEFDPRNWSSFEEVALKGRSATDVAGELGVDPQAIRQANYRIRRRLRLVLEDLVE